MKLYNHYVFTILLFMTGFFSLTSCSDDAEEYPSIEPACQEIIPDFSPGLNGKIAYDAHRNTIVFVAGKPFQTWKWQGDRWQRIIPEQSPPDLAWFEIQYFPPLQSVVLLGSEYQTGASQLRMWRYDGLTWISLEFSTGPVPGCKVVYDPLHERLLYTGILTSYDVWSYDGLEWKKLMKSETVENYLSTDTLGFDVSRNRLVLAGKYQIYSNVYSWNTWEYDGQGWLLVNSGKGPVGAAVYFPPTDELLVIVNLGSDYGTEVYSYDQGDWTRINYTNAFSAGQSATFDEYENVIYSSNPPNTFTFTPADGWQNVTFQEGPQFFYKGAAGFLHQLDQMVVVTQRDEYGSLFETWLWNGTEFREVDAPFEARYLGSNALCYYPLRQSMLLLAKRYSYGDSNIVWEFDGYQWNNYATTGLDTSLLYFSALIYCEEDDRIILHAGNNFHSSTYQLIADTWSLLATDQINPPRQGMNMVYNQRTGRIVLFGGITNSYYSPYCLNDTWEFDGMNWHQIETDTAPPFRQGGMMVYNPDIERVVLAGGSCGTEVFNDLWDYDGSTWNQRELNNCPLGRQYAAHGYDPVRHRFVICGGNNLTENFNSLVELQYQ